MIYNNTEHGIKNRQKIMKQTKTKEEIRKIQELRRSNAASFVPNMKKYKRTKAKQEEKEICQEHN
jgi:hypothetical protein